jgi:heme-degrading monooxygenase HmoA
MIVRTWRGRTESSRQHLYPEHFKRTILPEVKAIEGFLGASLLGQQQGAEVEFLVLTRWAPMDAITAFADEDVDKAVVEPAAMAALTSYDRTVCHYTVLDEIG